MTRQQDEKQPRLSFSAGEVVYGLPDVPEWRVPVDQLAVVGEYTDASGPYLDDYFLVFVKKAGERYAASFYAEGRDSLFSRLGPALDSELRCGLCSSTELKSRVMWPPAIKDKPLFDFVAVTATTLGERIKEWIMPTYELHLADAVREFLESERSAV